MYKQGQDAMTFSLEPFCGMSNGFFNILLLYEKFLDFLHCFFEANVNAYFIFVFKLCFLSSKKKSKVRYNLTKTKHFNNVAGLTFRAQNTTKMLRIIINLMRRIKLFCVYLEKR